MEETPVQFLNKLQACVKEWRKQLNATRDDKDAAHFFNSDLKRFLKNHQSEMNLLSTMNFDKSFISWLKNYLFKEEENA